MSKIHINIIPDGNENNYLMFVKKFTGMGIAEIKNRMIHEQSLATRDSFDEDHKIIDFITGIEKLGGAVRLYEEFEGELEELPLSHFYNLMERNQGIRADTDKMTTLESTKILAVIPAENLDLARQYKVIGLDKGDVIVEFEYDLGLKDFIGMIGRENIDIEFYQVDAGNVHFDKTDKISVSEILDLLNLRRKESIAEQPYRVKR